MTRKNFDAIARNLAMTRPEYPGAAGDGGSREQWEEDIQAVASAVAQFNAKFDRHRFLEACRTWESKNT